MRFLRPNIQCSRHLLLHCEEGRCFCRGVLRWGGAHCQFDNNKALMTEPTNLRYNESVYEGSINRASKKHLVHGRPFLEALGAKGTPKAEDFSVSGPGSYAMSTKGKPPPDKFGSCLLVM